MNDALVRYREAFQRFWNQYSKRQRLLFIGAFILSVATIALLVFQFSKTEYSVAFTDLNPTDAANVKGYLESASIPYKLSVDGRTIGVPSTMVSSVKIDVASQGLVTNGSIGYEIFRDNMNSWSMTDSQFDVLKADARAGEIQRLINQMNGVSSSEVLINVPEPSVFINAGGIEQQSSASVVVNFMPGFPPDQAKIDTIYNLVARSVPNLTLDNVTISDQNGELLPSSKLGGGAGASAGQIEQQLRLKKQFELELQRNIMNFLAPLLGKEDVIVSVFSTLNFDQKKSHQQLVTPVNEDTGLGIPISREVNEQSATSTGGELGGTAGTGETDIPGYPGMTSQGNTESESSNVIENFEINRITNEIISSPYIVQDLAVTVGINSDPASPQAVPPETVQQVQRSLMSIVGTSLANNGQTLTEDQLLNKVSVITRSFNGGTNVAVQGSGNQTLLYALAGAAVMALIAGGAFFLLRRRKAKEEAELARQAELELAAGAPVPEVVLDIENPANDNQIRKQLEQLARKRPEEFTNLLRTWLLEE